MDSPQSAPRRELTLRVIVFGIVLAIVMGAANVYVGLKVGMTVSASIPAAVMAMLLFRMFSKSSTVLEANQVQTGASAGESLAAGIIFTMPALILIGYWTEFDYWVVTGIAFTGGLLGILFMIPMRKVFVVDRKDLPYPEGVACAAVLESGEDGADVAGAKALVLGGAIGALFKFVEKAFGGLIQGTVEAAQEFGSRVTYYGSDISPMLVAVGLIVRLNVAALIFIGGAIGWLIVMPLLDAAPYFFDAEGVRRSSSGLAWAVWSNEVRYVGVGAMVLGGAMTLLQVRSGLVAAVSELRRKKTASEASAGASEDLPISAIGPLVALCIVMIALLYYHFTGNVMVTAVVTVVMFIMSFFMTAVASYIVGLVGNSNSPVSGMTITAVMVTGGVLYLLGFIDQEESMQAMVAILGVAAVVCCVACTAGDVCNDLKTGSIVGATPKNQQKMQILGVGVAALVMAPVMTMLHKGEEVTGGIGGSALPAPQAQLFASLVKGFTGEAQLPWMMILLGAGIGAVLLLIDYLFLKPRNSSFRLHLMPIAVGMYLPFGLATPILLGGIIAHMVSKGAKDDAQADKFLHRGVLLSSGVIAGEALLGVAMAGLAVKKWIPFNHKDSPILSTGVSTVASIALMIGALILFHRVAMAGRREADQS
tara:strand:- start:6976 stop:8925 length:1950 start_codon:yes stop_codon:yes gene_type:complete